jgi:hypothetical protein
MGDAAREPVTLEDVHAELRALRLELAAARQEQRKNKRRGAKRSATVAANTVAAVEPSALHVAKAKRLIRKRLGL